MESKKFVSVVSRANWTGKEAPRARVVVNLDELVTARETSSGDISMWFGSAEITVDRIEFATKVMPALGLSESEMPGKVTYA